MEQNYLEAEIKRIEDEILLNKKALENEENMEMRKMIQEEIDSLTTQKKVLEDSSYSQIEKIS